MTCQHLFALLFLFSMTVCESRSLLDLLPKVQARSLWIDPSAKPAQTGGFDVIISIKCTGKYNTVTSFHLRSALAALGLNTDPSKLAFGGDAALAGQTFMASFTINVPQATSQDLAVALIQGQVTVAGLIKATTSQGAPVKVLAVFFSAFSA